MIQGERFSCSGSGERWWWTVIEWQHCIR